jgi:hypothetical protein
VTGNADRYLTDDYPRTGCRVEVVCGAQGLSMRIYAPEDYPRPNNHLPIEVYSPSTPASAAVVLYDWLNGEAPRRYYREIQSICATS